MTQIYAPAISIVICTWNRSTMLRQTLDSVLNSAKDLPRRCEIIIVDNNSTDDTREVSASFASAGSVRYVFEATPGLSHARNRGVREATAEWVLFVDDDVLVEGSFLSCYLEAVTGSDSFGFLGGPVIPVFEGPQRAWTPHVLTEYWWIYSCLDLGASTRVLSETQFPFGANMCIRRNLLIEHPFSPNYGYRHGVLIPGEETELFHALRESGIRGMWLPECGLKHCLPAERNTLGYLLRRAHGQGVANGQVSRRSGKSVRWVVRDIPTAIGSTLLRLATKPSAAVAGLIRLAFAVGTWAGARRDELA
jgi:glycosyltransferase involved in cell wall biosynthesis